MNLGIIGAGQLARMMALAAYPLGLRCQVLDPSPDACAGQVAPLIQSAYDDAQGLKQLAAQVDAITFDFENVPAAAASQLQNRVPVYPPPSALAVAQDRLDEKRLFQKLGIATAPFMPVNDLDDLQHAADSLGLPAVLKTRRLGYDGKGQRLLQSESDLQAAYVELGNAPLILEGFIAFEREVSLLGVRSRSSEIVFYPLSENQHRDGILRLSKAPFDDAALTTQAQTAVTALLETLDYVGVLAVEFFVDNGQLLANEMAPRVHNSGHWTIEGAETSQFENHIRAVADLPLGATTARGYSAMINFIGALPQAQNILALQGAHYHDYGKEPRPGRKVGHLTLRADSSAALESTLAEYHALTR